MTAHPDHRLDEFRAYPKVLLHDHL
ncbi:MAG: hypothetical protein RLY45_1135, partial [Actinomycetota bacterium]